MFQLTNKIQNLPIEYRYLGILMGLPLLDGVFISIVLSGGLNTFIDALIVGGFVLGGGATIGIILSEFTNNTKITIKRTIIVGLIITIFAMIQASIAPVIEPFINIDRFKYGAIIALLILAYRIIPIGEKYHIFKPSIVLFIFLLFSIQFETTINIQQINYMAALYAFVASFTATTISLTTIVYRNKLINLLDIDVIKYTTGLGLILIAMNIAGLVPEITILIVFVIGFFISIYVNKK